MNNPSKSQPTSREAISAVGGLPLSVSGSGARRALADVAQDTTAKVVGRLDRVGMSGIEIPVKVRASNHELMWTPAVASAFVSLDDPTAKGIHMSRLFLALHDAMRGQELRLGMLPQVLSRFVESHAPLSRSAVLEVEYLQMVERRALLTDHAGWRSYPLRLTAEMHDGHVATKLWFRLLYSSTCPCSAALSRQLLQTEFETAFHGRSLQLDEISEWLGKNGSVATPHSQRSEAEITLVPLTEEGWTLTELIDQLEEALGTAVQTAVKRLDEQEFARLNGANLMFCEDAARRMRAVLERQPMIADYHIRATHLESLHPHDAVAIVAKGVPGGLRP